MATKSFKVRTSGDTFKVMMGMEVVFKDGLTEQEAEELTKKLNDYFNDKHQKFVEYYISKQMKA